MLPRQCGESGSAVAVSSSKHSRIVSRSHTPFLPPFVDCGRVSKKMYTREEVVWLRGTKFRVDRMSDVYLSVYHPLSKRHNVCGMIMW